MPMSTTPTKEIINISLPTKPTKETTTPTTIRPF